MIEGLTKYTIKEVQNTCDEDLQFYYKYVADKGHQVRIISEWNVLESNVKMLINRQLISLYMLYSVFSFIKELHVFEFPMANPILLVQSSGEKKTLCWRVALSNGCENTGIYICKWKSNYYFPKTKSHNKSWWNIILSLLQGCILVSHCWSLSIFCLSVYHIMGLVNNNYMFEKY